MSDKPLPIPQPDALVDAKGQTTQTGYRYLESLGKAARGLSSGLSSLQTWVQDQLALKANIASPTFTGVPAAPTAAATTNTTQIATTEFVQSAIATYDPVAPVGPTSGTTPITFTGAGTGSEFWLNGTSNNDQIQISRNGGTNWTAVVTTGTSGTSHAWFVAVRVGPTGFSVSYMQTTGTGFAVGLGRGAITGTGDVMFRAAAGEIFNIIRVS